MRKCIQRTLRALVIVACRSRTEVKDDRSSRMHRVTHHDCTLLRLPRKRFDDLARRRLISRVDRLEIDVPDLAYSWEVPSDRVCMRMHPRPRKPDAATGELCEANERMFRRCSSSSSSSPVVINDGTRGGKQKGIISRSNAS